MRNGIFLPFLQDIFEYTVSVARLKVARLFSDYDKTAPIQRLARYPLSQAV